MKTLFNVLKISHVIEAYQHSDKRSLINAFLAIIGGKLLYQVFLLKIYDIPPHDVKVYILLMSLNVNKSIHIRHSVLY